MKFKNILLYAALLSGMSFSSCTDFLDEDSNPNALSPSIFWKSEGDIMKGLTSVYGALQPNASWAIPFERYIVIDGYRSDEITHRDDVTSWMNISSFNVEPTNSVVKTEWTNLYKGINYANQCLTNIPTVPGDSESLNALKKQSIAEARFLRAYFYYRLYVNFGERVPIYKEALVGTDEEFYPPQANPGELVSLIETELKEVQSDLPESYEESEKGRVTRYTAAALLGKFYMFRKELSKAEVEFKKIIDKEGSLFGLMENWADNFDGMHKNNKESLFEIQFTGDRSGGQYEYNLFTVHLGPMAGLDAYEEAYPTDWMCQTLLADKTIDGKSSDRALHTLIFDDPECRPFYYENGKSFKDYHKEGEIFWHKYVTYTEGMSDYWDYSFFNVSVIRYADVLLLYAECLNDKGETTEAINIINKVRARVNVPALPLTMGKAEVLKHLQDKERPCELALEGSRWYDLVRWGIVEETLKAHNKPFVENYDVCGLENAPETNGGIGGSAGRSDAAVSSLHSPGERQCLHSQRHQSTIYQRVFHPTIALPPVRWPEEDLRLILLYEWQHFCNRDQWIKLVFYGFCCVFWWNPVMWLLKRQLDQLLELRCDFKVLEKLPEEERGSYYEMLLRTYRAIRTTEPEKQQKKEENLGPGSIGIE